MKINTKQTKKDEMNEKPLIFSFISSVFICFVLPFALPVFAQNFSRTFNVSSEASGLEVINQVGSIKVTTSDANNIVINAKRIDSRSQISATQNSEGKVKVEVNGHGGVDFEITVPPATNLDLITYKGAISVANLTGPVQARITTDGLIQFTGLRSPKVEAHSLGGKVTFTGDLLPDGEYKLKSFSGRVEVNFPSNADFTLSASSPSGVMEMDLDGMPLKFYRQTNQRVEAACGKGMAKLILWTQDGSIYLHRKP
ncbi:MAG: DUF4097 family beta strand repeat protein [Blastocatellia bacterium]|nr:DUF4097 family beta strand repeat protein [Blastocatellia bacterium]